jgi:hypothetical protein
MLKYFVEMKLQSNIAVEEMHLKGQTNYEFMSCMLLMFYVVVDNLMVLAFIPF